MTKKITSIIIGVLLIAAGILLMGNILEVWNVDIFFEGWWALFIIVPSVLGLFNYDTRLSSVHGIVIGGMLLIAARGIITWSMFGKIFFPLVLILSGSSIIFNIVRFKRDTKKSSENEKNYIAIFSGANEVYSNEPFVGANMTAVFGGIEIDLRNAIIKEDVTINCMTVFGGAEIYVPQNIKVKTKGLPIFGGIENKSGQKQEENAPTIFVNYTCIFGGVDIK